MIFFGVLRVVMIQMKLFKDIFNDGEVFFVGLGVFVLFPFFGRLFLGYQVEDLLLELILSGIIYIAIFIWVGRGGLSRLIRRNNKRG